jgi:hypothetical protein
MEILSIEELHDIISWLPHCKSFFVKNRERFSAEVLPKYFDHGAEYRSFTRRLLRWGFKRVPRGDEVGAFYHKVIFVACRKLCSKRSLFFYSDFFLLGLCWWQYFVKWKPELCSKIKACSRKPIGSVKARTRKSESSIVDETTLKEQHRHLQHQEVQLHRLQQQQLLLQQQQRFAAHQESFDIPHMGMKAQQQQNHDNLNLSNRFVDASTGVVWPEANINSRTPLIPSAQRGSGMHHAPNLFSDGNQFHDRMQNMPLNTSHVNAMQGMERKKLGTMIGQVFTQDSTFNRDLSHRYRPSQYHFDMAGAPQEDQFAHSLAPDDFIHPHSGPAAFFDKLDSEPSVDADAILAAAQRALHECDTLQTMGILDSSECSNLLAADLTRQQLITSHQNWQNQRDTKSRDARAQNSGAA